MSMTPVLENLYQISAGVSNAFLFDQPANDPREGLTLVDTGLPGNEDKVLDAIGALGRQPRDLKRILLTHGHADHIGSAGALQGATGAEVYIHAADASIMTSGTGFRPMQPSPGLKNRLIFTAIRYFVIRRHRSVQAATVAGHLEEGQVLPVAGGLRVIHVPGHCAGQVVFLWEKQGVLIAADTCGHQGSLELSIGYEHIQQGREDLRRLSALPFDVACFGHGQALRGGAAAQFKTCFGS